MSRWIVKRPDRPKPHLARFAPKGGRVVSKAFRTEREAKQWLTIQEAERLRGGFVDPRRGDLTLEDWSGRWLDGRRVRPSTRARDESVIRNLIVRPLGSTPLNRLTPEDVRAWLAGLESDAKAPATIAKAYQLLGQMVGQAVDDGRLARNPMPRKADLPKVEHFEMRVLTGAEVERLAEAINPRYRALVLVAAFTGFRFGEAAGLMLADFDALGRRIAVNRTLSEVAGAVSHGPPKTARSRRNVSIGQDLADELAAHIATYGTGSDGLIFTAAHGGPVRRTNFRRRVWLPAVTAVDLAPLRFHDLRHTHASWLISEGVHAKVIADRLGHASISTTMNTYGHLMPGLDDELGDRLEAAFGSGARLVRETGSVHEIRGDMGQA